MSDPRQQSIPGAAIAVQGGACTEAEAVARVAQRAFEPRVVDISRGTDAAAAALLVPQGMEVKSIKPLLDEYLPKPVRRSGTTVLHDLASFIAAVQRAKDEGTVVYLDAAKVHAYAVLDHDHAGPDGEATARWGGHRLACAIGLSPAWSAWSQASGVAMSQTDFAAFIDDHLPDILDPASLDETHPLVALMTTMGITPATPAEVVKASRGLKLRAEVNVTESITLESGEVELQYTETHTGQGEALRVPSAFLIALPVFDGAPRDVLLVRLRYRRIAGQPRVQWTAAVYQREEVRTTALRDLQAHIAAETGVPTFLGEPPAAKR